MARSNDMAARRLLGQAAALVAAGALVWAAQDRWLMWPAMFLMGIVWTHLFAAQHECAHGTAFRSRRANRVVAWICGALIMVPQWHFQYEHTAHHSESNRYGVVGLLTYWLLPLLMAQPVMRFIRMTEHVGCPHVTDPTLNTRTTRVAWVWQFLAWNMNFHGEHHLAPSVPFHALPALHQLLAGRIAVRAGYWGAHREIWARLRSAEVRGA
jgi:fatty acid desaturase